MLCCYDNCGESLIAMDYERHLIECGFRPINCDFCHQNIIQKDLDPHKEQCDERPAKCKGCGVDLKLKELKVHENECELMEIICATCEKSFLRKDTLGHDKMACFESAVVMLRKVLEVPLKERNKLNHPGKLTYNIKIFK